MQFYETKMGHQFFQCQLPALLSALQRIADTLGQPPKAVRLSAEVPADYLSDLYYGNLEPGFSGGICTAGKADNEN